MSIKTIPGAPASPAASGPAAQESRASQRSRRPSIFSNLSFANAPKNNSVSMGPRIKTPLLSPEQQTARSDGPTSGTKPWSMKAARSAVSRAEDRQEHPARPQTASTARTEFRPDARMAENVRPWVNGQENGQGGSSQNVGPVPGRNTPSQPSSQALAMSRPAVHTGNVRQPAARPRPAAGGAENADPNVGRLSPHAAVKSSMPTLVENFSTDRPLTPKQLVAAMVNLTKGTDFEGAVSQTIANNPKWGQQMQQRWNTLRLSIADAKDDGNAQVPSLQDMVARRPASFVKFMGGGNESSFARLMKPMPQPAPAQQVQPSAAPAVHAHAHSPRPSTRPQTRVDTQQQSQGPQQSPRTGHAAGRQGRNERKPADECTRLTVTLRSLDQQIADSDKKGKEIQHRMFHADTGPERIKATVESYAHRAEHHHLIASWHQVQAQLQRVGNGSAAGQPVGGSRHHRVGRVQASSAAERARSAELANARSIVAEGPPDLGKMYSVAIERVERNNHITQSSTMIEAEDKHMEHVDFPAIEKDYSQKLALYKKAKGVVDAAANPERTQAQAAAFREDVRAEAHSLATQAYHADVREAKDIVRQGPVSYSQVLDWARADARQNYMTVGSQRLDDDAIGRDYDRARERFEAAQQLVNKPLTLEETVARIDAQMAEAERRVRQRQEGAGQGR